MSREWLAVYTAMVTKPKYLRLSPIGRGALLHTWLLAGFQNPEATWKDADEIREALILAGFPEGVMDELVGLCWLEQTDDGLLIHDWDQHQWAATRDARNEWEAARKRVWRAERKKEAKKERREQDTTPQHSKRQTSGRGGDMYPPTGGNGNGETPCPECGVGTLGQRINKDGRAFIGCDRYPECRHAEPLPPKRGPGPVIDLNSEANRRLRAERP